MGMDDATRDGKVTSQNNPGDEMSYHGIIGKAYDLNRGLNHGYPYCHAAWDVDAVPNRGDLVVGNRFLVGDADNQFVANDTINDAVCAKERPLAFFDRFLGVKVRHWSPTQDDARPTIAYRPLNHPV